MATVPKRKHSWFSAMIKRRSMLKTGDARLVKWAPTLVKCPQCGELKVPHKVCGKCGYYKGQEVIKKEA